MSRGIRKDTQKYTKTRRASDPLALGPYLGALALNLNVSGALIAKMVGVHEQTVLRWWLSSKIKPVHALQVAKIVALLSWMHDEERMPLTGLAPEREAQLAAHAKDFVALATQR